MFKEPWNDISEYTENLTKTLYGELHKEVGEGHPLNGKAFNILAKREDRDDVLLVAENVYYIVHLTWKGKEEGMPWPIVEKYETEQDLRIKLTEDTEEFC